MVNFVIEIYLFVSKSMCMIVCKFRKVAFLNKCVIYLSLQIAKQIFISFHIKSISSFIIFSELVFLGYSTKLQTYSSNLKNINQVNCIINHFLY